MSNVAWLTEVKQFFIQNNKIIILYDFLVLVDHNNFEMWIICFRQEKSLHVKNLMDHNSEKYHYIFITFNINALN